MQLWMDDKARIVATNAFGMGIDKADQDRYSHTTSENIENYYQSRSIWQNGEKKRYF
jgi:superfamily II DNA helicase RecQ